MKTQNIQILPIARHYFSASKSKSTQHFKEKLLAITCQKCQPRVTKPKVYIYLYIVYILYF